MWELRGGGELAERAVRVVRGNDDVALCRGTAAWLWGVDVFPARARDRPVEVLVAPGAVAPSEPGIRAYRADPADWPDRGPARWRARALDLFGPAGVRDPIDGRVIISGLADDDGPGFGREVSDGLGSRDGVVLREGVRLTDPARTALDCARFLPRYPALVAVDAFAHAGVRIADVRRRCGWLAGGAEGRTQAAEVLALANWRAQSPEESWTRLLVVDAGLPRPWSQVPVDCPGGPFYLDVGYPWLRAGVEYDGEDHHSAAHQRAHDRRRRELIRAAGWDVVVVTYQDIHARPQDFLRSLLEVLLIHGWHPSDGRLLEVERRIRRIAARRHAESTPDRPLPP